MIISYLFVVVLLAIPICCHGGLKTESVTYGLGEEVRERTITYMDNNYIKIKKSNGKYKLIDLIDLDKGIMFEIDPKRKEYIYDTLSNIAKDLLNENKKVKESLRKHLSESDQNRLQNSHSAPKIKIDKTNEVLLIAGFRAIKYEVYVDKKLYQEVWITKDIEISRILKYEKFLKWMQELYELITDDSPFCYTSPECNKLFGEGLQMKKIQYGWTNVMLPQVEEVVKVERVRIPEKEFRILKPKRYKKVAPHLFYWAD